MNCPACGHTLSPGARFCNKCGTLVSQVVSGASETPAPAAAPVAASLGTPDVCPECGKSLKPDARFCTGCGAVLTSDGAAATSPVTVTEAATPEPQPTPETSGEAGVVVSPVVDTRVDVEEVDLLLSADDTRPMVYEESVLKSLPLHPVQRGMPDFELPDLPAPNERTARSVREETPRAPEPVNFDRLQDFSEPNALASANGAGALKWVALVALALIVVGAGWFGYRYFAGTGDATSAPAVAAQPAASPAEDDAAPAVGSMDAAVDAETAATAAAEDASAVEGGEPLDAATSAVESAAAADASQPLEAISSDQPVPVTVPPVRVLRDSPESGGVGSASNSDRRKSRNQSLDSLLD